MKKKSYASIFAILICFVGVYVLAQRLYRDSQKTAIIDSKKEPALDAANTSASLEIAPKDAIKYQEVDIKDNSSFYNTLLAEKVSPEVILRIVEASKKQFSLDALSPGTKVVLAWSQEKLAALRVLISGKKELQANADDAGAWEASLIEHEVTVELTAFFGEVKSTLWDSAVSAGMPFELISSLAEVFSSQIDFTRELNVGDEWSLLIERQMVGKQQVGFGEILAAEIQKHGETLPAFRFVAQGRAGYFDMDGNSLRGKFLKSPLRYNRITSHFQRRRFHPILKFHRPHQGVDFSAPTGTPVRSVGDGQVLQAGRHGGSGTMVKIRHDGRYMTAYKHLSKVGPGVRVGTEIEQGQIIGYVGQTGLATGPHLHFEFYEDGRYVDPLGKRFPRRTALDARQKVEFKKEMQRLSVLLEKFKKRGVI